MMPLKETKVKRAFQFELEIFAPTAFADFMRLREKKGNQRKFLWMLVLKSKL